MEELDLNTYLVKKDIFDLFCSQLIKDFESAGADVQFTQNLPNDLAEIKRRLMLALQTIMKDQTLVFPMLLYRIDLSEAQIKKYVSSQRGTYEELLAELIIKRLLQKVILKKKFSTNKPID